MKMANEIKLINGLAHQWLRNNNEILNDNDK